MYLQKKNHTLCTLHPGTPRIRKIMLHKIFFFIKQRDQIKTNKFTQMWIFQEGGRKSTFEGNQTQSL